MKKAFSKKRLPLWILGAILAFGAGLRLWHFSDWLHFELDQSRDSIFMSKALEGGIGYLPTLGPRASGTQLRLGPAYYYLQYLGSLVFGDTPQGHALLVPILGTFSIFAFYLLARRLFREAVSLALAFLYASSLFLVVYARFTWNPNLLPFFDILGLYALIRSLDKRGRHPARWFLLSVLLMAVATQLHFVAFFIVPLFYFLTLLAFRPRFSWKAWAASVAIILISYSPVIVNDIALGGMNAKEFLPAFHTREKGRHPIVEKLIADLRSGAESYAMILSGDDHIFTPKPKLGQDGWKLSCSGHCANGNEAVAWSAIAFFLVGAVLLMIAGWRKRGAYAVLGFWFASVFLVLGAIADHLAPRFYLMAAPLPFVFLGLMIEPFLKRWRLIGGGLLILAVGFFAWTNLSFLSGRFRESRLAGTEAVRIRSDRVAEEPARVTLAQQEAIARYANESYLKNGDPVLIFSEAFYQRGLRYLAERSGTPIIQSDDPERAYAHANAFVVLRTSNHGRLKRYLKKYDQAGEKSFGTLTVYALSPKPETASEVEPPLADSFDYIYVPYQASWKEVLAKFRSRT